MHIQAVDPGHELRDLVDPRLRGPPVVAAGPVAAQILQIAQRDALCPVTHRLVLGPPRAPQPFTQIPQRCAVHADREWLDLISHSRIIPGLTRVMVATNRAEAEVTSCSGCSPRRRLRWAPGRPGRSGSSFACGIPSRSGSRFRPAPGRSAVRFGWWLPGWRVRDVLW